MNLTTDPAARVLVFVDGQNLYKRCEALFGHPLCHPHLLAEHLAGSRTGSVAYRYYTGRPNQNFQVDGARSLDRRTSVMQRLGGTVVTRPLRYSWDWTPTKRLRPATEHAGHVNARLKPYNRPREKGIDLVLGLDVVEFYVKDVFDVAIIISLDRDLWEIPQAIRHLREKIRRPCRIEAAVPVRNNRRSPKILPMFDYTHQITGEVFEMCRDDTFYAAPVGRWIQPVIPATLAEARGETTGEQEPQLPLELDE